MIGNINSWQSRWHDNLKWYLTAFAILAMFCIFLFTLYICHFIQLWKEWGLEEDCFWWLVKVQQRKCQFNANIQVFIETFILLIILWLSHCLPSNIPMTICVCSCPATSVPTLGWWSWSPDCHFTRHKEWVLRIDIIRTIDQSDDWKIHNISISTKCRNEWRWNWTKR